MVWFSILSLTISVMIYCFTLPNNVVGKETFYQPDEVIDLLPSKECILNSNSPVFDIEYFYQRVFLPNTDHSCGKISNSLRDANVGNCGFYSLPG